VVYGEVGLTPLICWMHAVKRKNRFAYFENCSYRNLGMNVRTEYFAVETVFGQYTVEGEGGRGELRGIGRVAMNKGAKEEGLGLGLRVRVKG
jgi:hypothetical protein